MEVLVNHPWPGNIRELRNVIERAMLFCDECSIDLPHLPAELINAMQ
jgi:transcriptional regulator of acetoin/glycerol metabolism